MVQRLPHRPHTNCETWPPTLCRHTPHLWGPPRIIPLPDPIQYIHTASHPTHCPSQSRLPYLHRQHPNMLQIRTTYTLGPAPIPDMFLQYHHLDETKPPLPQRGKNRDHVGRNAPPTPSLTFGQPTPAPPPTPVHKAKNLGIIFDSDLNFSHQISQVTQTAMHKLRTLRHILPLFQLNEKKQLVSALVLSKLDYASSLYIGLPKKTLQRLQGVINYGARLVCGLKKYDHISPALKSLGWLPIQQRIELRVLSHVHHSIWGNAPQYLKKICPKHTPLRTLRSSALTRCQTPRYRCKTKGGRSLAAQGATLWNNLPTELQNTKSFPSFKRKLQKALLSNT